MTRPITFQEAQQAVAEKHGPHDWDDLLEFFARGSHDELYREVAELMANEAVNADRSFIFSNIAQFTYIGMDYEVHVNKRRLGTFPLPFPEER